MFVYLRRHWQSLVHISCSHPVQYVIMRYRHVPKEVEAWQLTSENAMSLYNSISKIYYDTSIKLNTQLTEYAIFFKSNNVTHICVQGDYIVKKEEGYYVVPRRTFETHYEPILERNQIEAVA